MDPKHHCIFQMHYNGTYIASHFWGLLPRLPQLKFWTMNNNSTLNNMFVSLYKINQTHGQLSLERKLNLIALDFWSVRRLSITIVGASATCVGHSLVPPKWKNDHFNQLQPDTGTQVEAEDGQRKRER